MPLLNVVGEGRLIAARLEGAKAHRLPRFPYLDNIETMAGGAPDWPGRTADISEIGIDMHFVPAGAVGKLLGRISGSAATLTIRIVDYPGEWLLDLPLLGQSFAEWSRATLRLYRKGVRAEIAGDFLAYLAPASARRDRERGGREAGARPLLRVPPQGARPAWPELPAARPLPLPRQPRRRALSLVCAARHRRRASTSSRRTRSAR